MKLNQIKSNPNNPRIIKDEKFKKLCESIKALPKMMELRPIVVDENFIVQGGNMRLKALNELGYKEIPDTWVKQAKDFTEEELNRFRAVNESVQKVIEINKSKASCRAPDRAIEYFKNESPSRRDVLELFITWIRAGEMYETGDYQMAKYIEEVIIKTTAQEDLSWYVDSRLKRIFRD